MAPLLALIQVVTKEPRLHCDPGIFHFQSGRQKSMHLKQVRPPLTAVDWK